MTQVRTRFVLFGVLALLLAVFLAPGVAQATDVTNAVCLGCHTTGAGVTAPEVDFASTPVAYSVCVRCHYSSRHYTNISRLCIQCHKGADPSAPYYAPLVSTPYGWFSSADSVLSGPADLHRIHVNGDWVGSWATGWPDSCGQCHGALQCDVCHAGPIAHGTHSDTIYEPVSYVTGDGVSMHVTSSPCVNEACHALSSADSEAFVPRCDSCHSVLTTGGVHHEVHDASAYNNNGCTKCHSMYLDVEHANRGLGCFACHGSMNDRVVAAIATGDLRCIACHQSPPHRYR